jgi:hypothetical protein
VDGVENVFNGITHPPSIAIIPIKKPEMVNIKLKPYFFIERILVITFVIVNIG